MFSVVHPVQYLFDLELYNSQEDKVGKTTWIASWKVIELVKTVGANGVRAHARCACEWEVVSTKLGIILSSFSMHVLFSQKGFA